jgi:hypothetical protein
VAPRIDPHADVDLALDLGGLLGWSEARHGS